MGPGGQQKAGPPMFQPGWQRGGVKLEAFVPDPNFRGHFYGDISLIFANVCILVFAYCYNRLLRVAHLAADCSC